MREVVRDLIIRTRVNLEFIEHAEKRGEPVYEATQLLNSLLSLLVVPKEQWQDRLPKKSIPELRKEGWPLPRTLPESESEPLHLRVLVRYMRNAIAHGGFEPQSERGQLSGVRLINRWERRVVWAAEISLADLRSFVIRLTEEMTYALEQVA